jgi:nucleotide-binding universal stress UspA family protein
MKRILAFIDFSEVTSDLIRLAGELARGMNSRLTLLHVAMPDTEFIDGKPRDDCSRRGIALGLRRRRREMAILRLELTKLGTDATALLVRGGSARGNPTGKILQEIDRLAPDLIVVGSHPHGRLFKFVMGGTTEAVVRKACCPVLLVPRAAPRPGEPNVLTSSGRLPPVGGAAPGP